ncbi:MAG: hypothetical protein GAK28_00132 [Luteibacter sp.]|uniref:hypothetical protein n=1 Tax=Luteibacter sp. TaxID=1886636 RepID=UPI00137FD6B4|nr:hypothetical protein [Luteibacter sp.]KAF1009494.1 MAG: hypothetical protein GAK28_00132 [Luteibacter sp.]
MPDESALPLTLNTAPKAICDQIGVPGCIVLIANVDGSIGFSAHGVSPIKANELLSVGIHINLSQHDQMVRDGAAGEYAQSVQASIDAEGGAA